MIDPTFNEPADPNSFEGRLYRTCRKMTGTLYNSFQQLFDKIYLIVSPHTEDTGAEMTAFFEYDGKIRVFERVVEFRVPHPENSEQVITFNVTDELVARQYEVLQAGVDDLNTAFDDFIQLPAHIYMTFDGETKTVYNELEYLHPEDTSDHEAAASNWLVELEKGDKAFFQNMLKEFDMGL